MIKEHPTIREEAELFFEICTSQLFGIPTTIEFPKWKILLSDRDKKNISYIRSILAYPTKNVNEEWVDKWAKKIDRLYVGNRNVVLRMLEELGISVAVEEKQ